jgi:hypothetical protein
MPPFSRDEHALRERITQLRSLYERMRRRMTALLEKGSASGPPPASELSRLLDEVSAAEPALKQIVTAWTVTRTAIRLELAADVEQLRSSAAACLDLVSSAEQSLGRQRDGVSHRIDENSTRNRAIRAYSAAMRR